MKRRIFSIILVAFSVFLLMGCQVELRARVDYVSPNPYEQTRIEMIAIAEKATIAVKTDTGHGSGIIYDFEEIAEKPGTYLYYALTNHHVIEEASEAKIHFGDNVNDINVRDIASNARYDIAVLRFESTRVLDVHTVKAFEENEEGQSVYLQLLKGQDVYAIGSPQSLSHFNYVTQGVISLLGVTYNQVPGLAFMHDAELNPGNSGGPMFNLNGDLIGINVAKISNINTNEGVIAAEGLNYTLSINALAPVVLGFDEEDYYTLERKARLGVTVQEVAIFLSENDASLLPPDPVGVVVIEFDYTRNAHLVLEQYDLIIEMNGIAITSIADLSSQLVDAEFGDIHELKVLRKVGDAFIEVIVEIELA
ncbi:MAG: serine protease [Bacillota bacterium]|nr:MAG: serine protease [Bacillota bacterium]